MRTIVVSALCALALAANAQTVYVTGTYSSICGCVQKVMSDDAEGGLSSGL